MRSTNIDNELDQILGRKEIILHLPNRFLEKNFSKVKTNLYKMPVDGSSTNLFYNKSKRKLFGYNGSNRLSTNDLLTLKEVQLVIDFWKSSVRSREDVYTYLENQENRVQSENLDQRNVGRRALK